MLGNLKSYLAIIFHVYAYENTVFDVLKRASCKSILYNKSIFRIESRLKNFLEKW